MSYLISLLEGVARHDDAAITVAAQEWLVAMSKPLLPRRLSPSEEELIAALRSVELRQAAPAPVLHMTATAIATAATRADDLRQAIWHRGEVTYGQTEVGLVAVAIGAELVFGATDLDGEPTASIAAAVKAGAGAAFAARPRDDDERNDVSVVADRLREAADLLPPGLARYAGQMRRTAEQLEHVRDSGPTKPPIAV